MITRRSEEEKIMGETTLADIVTKTEPVTAKSSSPLAKIIVVILIVAIAAAGWFFWQYSNLQQEKKLATDPQAQQAFVKKAIDQMVSKVEKHMLLPQNETPEMATVSDPNLLTEQQPFYQGVQKGDVVLIYLQAKKAIVYSPVRDRIINVGPVYLSDDKTASPKSTATSTPA